MMPPLGLPTRLEEAVSFLKLAGGLGSREGTQQRTCAIRRPARTLSSPASGLAPTLSIW